MADNTFLGLKPYSEDDAYRFKGRNEESQELFKLIARNDYTVCYAESGEGKTSLLNAGVFPLLRENMYFPIEMTFTENDYQTTPDRFDRIIDRCISDSIAAYNEKSQGIRIEYQLCSTDFAGMEAQSRLQQELSHHSWWKLRNYKPQAMGLTFTPVFVFDQFEEVFSMPGSTVWTLTFFKWLEEVSADSCPKHIASTIKSMIGTDAAFPAIKEEKGFKAVFSLRKEFMGELDYWGMQKCFIPALKDNRYCLKPLTYLGAQKVMQQQSSFEAGKMEQVLHHFVSLYSREPQRTISENLPAIPALLLSVVCNSWEKNLNYFATTQAADIAQSLHQILEQFYNETLSAVVGELTQTDPSTPPATLRHDIDTALFALVDANSKRVRTKTTSSVLTAIDFDQKYKKSLSDHRIIKVSKIENEDYVEIVHDALCPIVNKKKEERLAAETKEKMRKKWRVRIKVFMLGSITFMLITILMVSYGQWKEEKGLNASLALVSSRVKFEEHVPTYSLAMYYVEDFLQPTMQALNDSCLQKPHMIVYMPYDFLELDNYVRSQKYDEFILNHYDSIEFMIENVQIPNRPRASSVSRLILPDNTCPIYKDDARTVMAFRSIIKYKLSKKNPVPVPQRIREKITQVYTDSFIVYAQQELGPLSSQVHFVRDTTELATILDHLFTK